ncbi:hypothetical protein BH20CHL6_BH20CHL6_13230 [soil metagenome]
MSNAPRLYLGHGAAGSAASMRAHVEGMAQRGLDAVALDLPRGKAERAVPVFRTAAPPGAGVAVGGQSFGGRVASLCAAEGPYAALVLLSYPLHRPGTTDWEVRVAHWPRITCPVLLLSGESDPFARLSLLRDASGLLAHAELVTYPKLGHRLAPVLDDVLDRVAQFLQGLPPHPPYPPHPLA